LVLRIGRICRWGVSQFQAEIVTLKRQGHVGIAASGKGRPLGNAASLEELVGGISLGDRRRKSKQPHDSRYSD
jgi:hypothetical protein